MKTKTDEIDDLLKVVSPELIAGWEAKNLDGKTLKEVNELYLSSSKDSMTIFRNVMILGMFVAVSSSVAFIISLTVYLGEATWYMQFAPFVAIFVIFIWYVFYISKKETTKAENASKCRVILDDFRNAVEALSPLETNSQVIEHTPDSVWGTLFSFAIQKIEAKNSFFKACKEENPSQDRIQKAIDREKDCLRLFNIVFARSEKFNLNFSKSRIFKAAQEEIDQRSAWKQ